LIPGAFFFSYEAPRTRPAAAAGTFILMSALCSALKITLIALWDEPIVNPPSTAQKIHIDHRLRFGLFHMKEATSFRSRVRLMLEGYESVCNKRVGVIILVKIRGVIANAEVWSISKDDKPVFLMISLSSFYKRR